MWGAQKRGQWLGETGALQCYNKNLQESATAACLKPSSSLAVQGCWAWSPLTSSGSIIPSLSSWGRRRKLRGSRMGCWLREPICLRTGWVTRERWPQADTMQWNWLSSMCNLTSSCSPKPRCQPTGVHLAPLSSHWELQTAKSPCSLPFSSPLSIYWGVCPAPAHNVAEQFRDPSSCMKRRGHQQGSGGKAWKHSLRKAWRPQSQTCI